MKKLLVLVSSFLLLLVNAGYAQKAGNDSVQDRTKHFSIGVAFNSLGSNYGESVVLTSPYWGFKSTPMKMAVRLSDNIEYMYTGDNGNYTMVSYNFVRCGLVFSRGILNNAIRVYEEAGVSGLFGNNSVTSENLNIGAYGILGFEFFISRRSSFYTEMGVTFGNEQSPPTADRLPGSPLYGYGFMALVGSRFYF